jgi:hypothetical protein
LLQRINVLEHTMEYLGILSVGFAIAGVSLRCYFSMREKAILKQEAGGQLSPRARRVQEAAIVRRLLRHHRGLAQA